jgi:uncharacterized protein YutE (UPF0331/DUF86 family)
MTRDAVIEERFSEMEENLQILDELKAIPFAQFQADPKTAKLAERCLQLAIECILDVAHHLIATRGWPRAGEGAAALATLGARDVLPADFAANIAGMANLRNILVHNYVRIDRALVYGHMRRLENFRAFQRHVLAFLDREGSPAGR